MLSALSCSHCQHRKKKKLAGCAESICTDVLLILDRILPAGLQFSVCGHTADGCWKSERPGGVGTREAEEEASRS